MTDLRIVGGALPPQFQDGCDPRRRDCPPVCHVVFFVVGHQICEGEAVVCGDEVDARAGAAATGLRTDPDDPVSRDANSAPGLLGCAPPVVTHSVAVFPVPLGPQNPEIADLVTAPRRCPTVRRSASPDSPPDPVAPDRRTPRAGPRQNLAGQCRGQVEPESVDVHLEHPVPQRIHDQLERVRIAGVETVAGAGEVLVVAQIAVEQAVVGGIVDAPEVQRGPEVIASAVVADTSRITSMPASWKAFTMCGIPPPRCRRLASRRTGSAARRIRPCCAPSNYAIRRSISR